MRPFYVQDVRYAAGAGQAKAASINNDEKS